MVLGVKGQRLRLGFTAIRRGFELYECLLVSLFNNVGRCACILQRCGVLRLDAGQCYDHVLR